MRILWAALALAAALPAQVDNNANGWYMYFGDHAFGQSRFGAHLEGQWRRTNLGLTWQQLLLRPALNFQVHPNVMLTGGYGFVETYRYGDYPSRERFSEHRTFEQAQIVYRQAGLRWQHRLRMEQRHIQGFAARYENRFRYMLRTDIPLPGTKRYSIGLYDEVFVNFGKNVADNVFDQNRAYVALVRSLGHRTRIEGGFMEQAVQHRDGRVFEHNHTLQVAIYSSLPFGRH